MHFDPESLSRFTLVYENDHYRLYQVTGSPQPIFATDHPLFYQNSILEHSNRDVEAFRKLTVEVMLTYSDAVQALAGKNADGARRRLEWCLLQAPQYSQARLALADALLELNRYPDAERVIAKLIEYAPDNTSGLYYAAYISAQMGKTEEAKQYLMLLLSVERDPALINRARSLQASIDQGLLPRGRPRS
jgi:tetratricopeptide (TPR) repeat protein